MPIACRPATPAPSTRTLAGRAVPAAVISRGKNRPNALAATSAALYPATLACELSASIGWARDRVRGSPSMLTAVTPLAARSRASSGLISVDSIPTTACPDRIRLMAAGDGRVIVSMTSALAKSSAVVTITAPASAYALSGNQAASPAPFSTSTSAPAAISFGTVSGTRATRRSPGVFSLTTATFMRGPRSMWPGCRASS